jgi:shikimate dehydrogenase
MDIYGLVGNKLSHSFSPEYFKRKFHTSGINADYRLFEIKNTDDLPNIIDNNNIKGLNITIPFKRSVGQLTNSLDKVAQITGSVNTIKIASSNGKKQLLGYNTDVIGFEKTLKPLIKGRKNLRAMILGTGGSAHSVAYVLRKFGILFCYISRDPSKILHLHYNWITETDIKNNLLIINTTPLGMYPNNESFPPIPYEYITSDHILYDLNYNPEETVFLQRGKEKGATYTNGKKMLEIQANESWKIWNK